MGSVFLHIGAHWLDRFLAGKVGGESLYGVDPEYPASLFFLPFPRQGWYASEAAVALVSECTGKRSTAAQSRRKDDPCDGLTCRSWELFFFGVRSTQ